MDIVRDSIFGQCVRLITRNKVFLYEDEKNPELWEKYVNKEKSGNMATHGQPQAPKKDEKDETSEKDQDSDSSRRPASKREGSQSSNSTIVNDSENVNQASGRTIDQEKGKDNFIIDWYGDDDQDVSFPCLYHRVPANMR